MLEVASLAVYRGNVQALRDVSLTVGQGEIVTLVGANGAGKSTLLYAIAGLLASRAGRIVYGGQTLNGLSPENVARLGIRLIPEGRQIFGTLSVLDNLLLGTYVNYVGRWGQLLGDIRHILKNEETQRRLKEIFAMFPILEERQKQSGGSLSGGEQQMLAIARALMSAPSFLLLDEPSMGLAPLLVSQMLGLLSDLRGMGLTILLVEQNAHEALRVADRGYILETGRIVAEGSSKELLGSDRIQRAYLGRARATG